MRRSLLLTLSITLCCLPALFPARAQDAKLLSLLNGKNKQIEDAIVKGDLTPVRNLFAPTATIINPVGGVASFDDFLGLLASGTLKYTATEASEEKLTQLGNVAVLIYLSKDNGTMQGHDISGKIRRTEVWAQQAGQWKIVSVQSTPVVSQPQ